MYLIKSGGVLCILSKQTLWNCLNSFGIIHCEIPLQPFKCILQALSMSLEDGYIIFYCCNKTPCQKQHLEGRIYSECGTWFQWDTYNFITTMIEAGGHGAVAAVEGYISLYTRNQELTRNGTSLLKPKTTQLLQQGHTS